MGLTFRIYRCWNFEPSILLCKLIFLKDARGAPAGSWFCKKPAEAESSWFREKPAAVETNRGLIRFLTKPATLAQTEKRNWVANSKDFATQIHI